MSRYYDRQGHPMTLMEWATTFDEDNRRIGLTEIGKHKLAGLVKVSTVWLGLDHRFGEGPPLIFETMVFGGEHDQYTEWYTTEAQAKAGHERIVKALQAGKEP